MKEETDLLLYLKQNRQMIIYAFLLSWWVPVSRTTYLTRTNVPEFRDTEHSE